MSSKYLKNFKTCQIDLKIFPNEAIFINSEILVVVSTVFSLVYDWVIEFRFSLPRTNKRILALLIKGKTPFIVIY